MNNFDIGKTLLLHAYACYNDMLRVYEQELWNMVVRRAQEAVELFIKSLLKIMGTEYPKNHNPGEIFEQICIRKGIKIELDKLDKIKRISSDLAEKRAPAFYIEEIYDKQHADKAKADAELIMNFTESLVKILKNESMEQSP